MFRESTNIDHPSDKNSAVINTIKSSIVKLFSDYVEVDSIQQRANSSKTSISAAHLDSSAA